ncbi:type IV conjugative transfer system protein TraE [Candidatus Protochlamydia phocaeensis]|uniref:type IV conjugative transfer system protein TraE n=1 Tax=Candidatus Protochlamydia phocaeensis TaxID=1414722 RepID=UPI000838C8E4|nr:type IV conjugative transfer system protein TraE [Candidatus Protochlamydia phocaeensis]
MNQVFLEKNIQFLIFQRNIFAAISMLLSIALILSSVFLFFKSDRIVIVPPVIEKEFWVDSNGVSPTYLEQMGCFLGQQLLTKSAYSAPMQRAILLRHADASYIGILKQKLLEEEELLKKQSTSYVFYPIETKVNPKTLEVILNGERQVYIAGKQISTDKEAYILQFNFSGSKLLLKRVAFFDRSSDGGSND